MPSVCLCTRQTIAHGHECNASAHNNIPGVGSTTIAYYSTQYTLFFYLYIHCCEWRGYCVCGWLATSNDSELAHCWHNSFSLKSTSQRRSSIIIIYHFLFIFSSLIMTALTMYDLADALAALVSVLTFYNKLFCRLTTKLEPTGK